MKVFFIFLLIDLCIGFYLFYGWEIVIGFFLEYLGFVYNKYIIFCFVLIFLVILDIVFKYWIFCYLNCIFFFIVVMYYIMNE